MKTPLVSIIVVNWNGGEVLGDCLESLLKIDYPNWELVVVDNGSTDGSDKLTKLIKGTKLIRNKKNVGFAVANNQGYGKAKGEYVLLLNNDTKVERNFLRVLVSKMEADDTIGVVQPKIKIMDNPAYLDNAGSFITRTGLLQHWGFMQKDRKEFSREREVFSAKGACMLIRRIVIERVGLFDKHFVSYMEESDFCWRVWLAGWTVLYFPKAEILHKVGFTSKRLSQVRVNFHSNKNRILSLYKNLNVVNLILIFVPHVVFILFLGIYYLIFKRDLEGAGIFFKAVAWNIRKWKVLRVSRKRTQKLRKVSDKYIFNKVGRKVNIQEMFSHFKKVEANF